MFRVCGPIVVTSNSTQQIGRWIKSRIASSNERLWNTKTMVSSKESGVVFTTYKRPKSSVSSSSTGWIYVLLFMLFIKLRMMSILGACSYVASLHVSFWVSILDYNSCHIPLMVRCPIKKGDHIRPTYLPCGNYVQWCMKSQMVITIEEIVSKSTLACGGGCLWVHCRFD